jgi:ribosomal-protein-alanine N-acetyltransferase
MWFAADEGELGDIAVLPELRGAGIGRTLLQEGIALAASRGTRSLFLEVREANDVARRLYATVGFHVVGVRKQYYTEPVEDAIVMRLDLQDAAR